MEISYHCQPAYTMAVCMLGYKEVLRVESGAMATMSDAIQVKADTGPGNIISGLMRKGLGGESLFMGRYQAEVEGAWVAVTPKLPGDIVDIDLNHNSPGIVAEAGSLLALSDGIDVDVRWAGVRKIVLREGATMLHITAEQNRKGKVLLCTYGGFIRHYLQPDQRIIVDTGHLVAYEDTVSIRVGTLGGAVTAALSGEGLVASLTGPGAVYVQSRAETEFKNWLFPTKKQNG